MSAAAGGSADITVSIVWVTVPSTAVGKKIATELVGSKLAACVNIIPGTRGAQRLGWDVPARPSPLPSTSPLVPSRHRPPASPLPGLESVYFWEGKVQSDAEALLKIKTRSALVPQLSEAVKQLHP